MYRRARLTFYQLRLVNMDSGLCGVLIIDLWIQNPKALPCLCGLRFFLLTIIYVIVHLCRVIFLTSKYGCTRVDHGNMRTSNKTSSYGCARALCLASQKVYNLRSTRCSRQCFVFYNHCMHYICPNAAFQQR